METQACQTGSDPYVAQREITRTERSINVNLHKPIGTIDNK